MQWNNSFWVITAQSQDLMETQENHQQAVKSRPALEDKNCPCCSHRMLQHIRNQKIYWFCRKCWQEMPLLNVKTPNLFSTSLVNDYSSLHLFEPHLS
jgi:hypothetical protein